MPGPIIVRTRTESEHKWLKVGLRWLDCFELQHSQIILASARREYALAIAHSVDYSEEVVMIVIKAINLRGVQALKPSSRRSHKLKVVFGFEQTEQPKEILDQSLRNFGKPSSIWTCEMAAEVRFVQKLIQERVSGETIRVTLQQMGMKRDRGMHCSPA